MSNLIVRRCADAEQVSRTAAEEWVRIAKEAIAARGMFTVALGGGSTPKRLYQLLSDAPFRQQVDWPKVQFFWGDERGLPPEHKDSNYKMAQEAMLQKLAPAADHVHRMEAERTDLDAAARDYQAKIARVFGVPAEGEPPAFDFIILGMGPDGHTASLFPHSPGLSEKKRWVVGNQAPKNTPAVNRLTFTYPLLNRGINVVFLVAGNDKTDRLVEVLEGPADPVRLPSQVVRPTTGKLLWLVDQAAAAKLKPTTGAG